MKKAKNQGTFQVRWYKQGAGLLESTVRKPLSQIPSDAILSPLVIEQGVCLYIPEDLVSIH